MAARLTDRQKKKIVADYLETESYNATAKINGVSKDTVKRVVLGCEGFAQKAQQKKRQNTLDITLSEEIAAWNEKNGTPGPYTSESFGGYSYSKATNASGVVVGWQDVFKSRLNAWRRIGGII